MDIKKGIFIQGIWTVIRSTKDNWTVIMCCLSGCTLDAPYGVMLCRQGVPAAQEGSLRTLFTRYSCDWEVSGGEVKDTHSGFPRNLKTLEKE